jgi:SWIM zinc finger
MRVVVRNEKYAKRHLYAGSQPETFTYEGQQVPAYKWSEPGTICLATGDLRWPVREIHPINIISIDDTEYSLAPVSSDRIIQIAGSKGSTYHVTISNGKKTCSCPGFAFRRECKHVRDVS